MIEGMEDVLVYDKLFINNEFIYPRKREVYESINPATGKVWAMIARGGREDIDEAVRAARIAFEQGPWRLATGTSRAHMLRKLGDLIAENAEKLAYLESMDNGKPFKETLNGEIPMVKEWFYYYAGLADKVYGTYIPIDHNVFTYTKKDPVGVVGAIIPWNSPMMMIAWKVAPALAAGNTIVIKPAEQTSVTAYEFARLVVQAGFPPGVVNIVSGIGGEAGSALASHPDVDKVAFTGSGRTAQSIAKESAVNLKRLSFELGGKAPHIIFDDADMKQALIAAASGIFINAGQTCAAGSRLLLSAKIYDEFLEKLVQKAQQIRVGNPMDERTHMGPQSLLPQLLKIESYVNQAKEEGATILTGGIRSTVPGFEEGFYYTPTIITNVSNQAVVCQEEIFGPVLTVIPFETEEEAIQLANDVSYGLTAGLWTNDIRKAHRVADRVRAGMVWVNNYRKFHWTVPYGGFKMSGYGRENGLEVLDLYTETKSIMMDIAETRMDPYNN
jgi:(Z)-2-((N-methylformamido)methylene)-5-hydroxybutyrolactone dehydrogenase